MKNQNERIGLKISVIIPTLNEEEFLGRQLRHLRETAIYGPIEIIVVDGQSKDNSVDVARGFADKFLLSQHAGRAYQMHLGALAATGDIFLFLHADTRLPENWQKALLSAWQQNALFSATAFRLGFEREAAVYRFIAWAAHGRTHLTGVPHGDQVIAVRSELYFRVGGFPDVPLMEEYYLCHKLKRFGEVKILEEAVMTSSRLYEKNGPLFNALRNSFLVILHYLGFSPGLLAQLYRWSRSKASSINIRFEPNNPPMARDSVSPKGLTVYK